MVAVSEVDRQALLRLDPALDVTVIPNGVDLEFNRPGVTPGQAGMGSAALVFTGKMDYRPNIDAVTWFVDAVFPLIRQSAPDARFFIVGQQPHPRVAALAERPGIIVTGRVPDTRPYIAGAAVYVIPLRIGGGTRLKVLEAMAMGQALVSTRLGCDGFPFKDGQRSRVRRRRRRICASKSSRCCAIPSGARRLGRRARAFVEAHYGWDAIVPPLEALYRVSAGGTSGAGIRLNLLRCAGAGYPKAARRPRARVGPADPPRSPGRCAAADARAACAATRAARRPDSPCCWARGAPAVERNPDLDAVENLRLSRVRATGQSERPRAVPAALRRRRRG